MSNSKSRLQAKRTNLKRMAALLAAPVLAGALPGASAFAADNYPSKPVRVVVNFPPGGPLDVVARLVTSKLQGSLKQPFVVENISGAAGNIGANTVAKADPDGYTILFSIDTVFTMNPSLYPSMPFSQDALKPILLAGTGGSAIVVGANTGITSLKELIEKGRKEEITFSSAGNGSPGHLASAMLADVTGMKIVHVPYRGNAPAIQALLGGEVQAGVLATSSMMPHFKSKKITPLALASQKRSPALPDVPSTAELGLPSVELDILYLAMAPAKTPDAIVQTLQKAMADALKQPDVQERLRGVDVIPAILPPGQTAAMLAKYRERYSKVIKEKGMKVD